MLRLGRFPLNNFVSETFSREFLLAETWPQCSTEILQYSTVQHNAVQEYYSTIQFSTIKYSTGTLQYSKLQYRTEQEQCSTVQYSAVQEQYSAVQEQALQEEHTQFYAVPNRNFKVVKYRHLQTIHNSAIKLRTVQWITVLYDGYTSVKFINVLNGSVRKHNYRLL